MPSPTFQDQKPWCFSARIAVALGPDLAGRDGQSTSGAGALVVIRGDLNALSSGDGNQGMSPFLTVESVEKSHGTCV